MEYKGHHYIKIEGDAHTPQRFWQVTLATMGEYAALIDEEKMNFKPINQNHIKIIHLHFGAI